MKRKPVLVTLTAPSSAGKSHLLNYIRSEAQLPCLISTTTRAPRAGERHGVDYYFISEEESRRIEEANGFAELAVYGGVRYGVTREEFADKLSMGLAFLIVEPSGIDHYVAPAIEMGAIHLKYYIHTDLDTRLARFKQRIAADIERDTLAAGSPEERSERITASVMKHVDRLVSMTTVEHRWGEAAAWDRILFGTSDPAKNLAIIISDVQSAVAADVEREEWLRERQAHRVL